MKPAKPKRSPKRLMKRVDVDITYFLSFYLIDYLRVQYEKLPKRKKSKIEKKITINDTDGVRWLISKMRKWFK